jgi:hypothetical protein
MRGGGPGEPVDLGAQWFGFADDPPRWPPLAFLIMYLNIPRSTAGFLSTKDRDEVNLPTRITPSSRRRSSAKCR